MLVSGKRKESDAGYVAQMLSTRARAGLVCFSLHGVTRAVSTPAAGDCRTKFGAAKTVFFCQSPSELMEQGGGCVQGGYHRPINRILGDRKRARGAVRELFPRLMLFIITEITVYPLITRSSSFKLVDFYFSLFARFFTKMADMDEYSKAKDCLGRLLMLIQFSENFSHKR